MVAGLPEVVGLAEILENPWLTQRGATKSKVVECEPLLVGD